MRELVKITIPMLLLAALALFFYSEYSPDYRFECTVDRVEGTFVTTRTRIKFSGNRMISLYRFTDGKRRTFMFPAERVSCKEI